MAQLSRLLLLEMLEKQGFCCALSGIELSPDNAAVDHKIPLTCGGKHDATNAQILDATINRMKGTLTTEEFVSYCEKVVDFAHERVARTARNTA